MHRIFIYIFSFILFVKCSCENTSFEDETAKLPEVERELKTHTSEQLNAMRAFSLEVLKVVNMIRTNPKEFLKHLIVVKDNFEKNRINFTDYKMQYNGKEVIMKTHEGIGAINEAIYVVEEMANKNYTLPVLKYNPVLDKPALLHAKYMDKFNFFAHEFDKIPSFKDPGKRFAVYCRYTACGENLWSGRLNESSSLYAKALEIVTDLFIDDGVANRGHRSMLLSTGVTDLGNSLYKTTGGNEEYLSVMNFGKDIIAV